jgi:hypothetical protein
LPTMAFSLRSLSAEIARRHRLLPASTRCSETA